MPGEGEARHRIGAAWVPSTVSGAAICRSLERKCWRFLGFGFSSQAEGRGFGELSRGCAVAELSRGMKHSPPPLCVKRRAAKTVGIRNRVGDRMHPRTVGTSVGDLSQNAS